MKALFKSLVCLSVIFLLTASCVKKFEPATRDRNFNAGWKFTRDSLPAGTVSPEVPEFDDSKWSGVDLPHDWSMMALSGNENDSSQIGPFLKTSPGNTSTGYAIGGTAWYRKHFKLGKADEGKTVTVKFDGVYMETEVWVNGKHAGNHVYGYTPFYFDVTSFLNKAGIDNVITVKVSNTGRNSRWYSGSGIYRNVTLSVTDPVHVSMWGVQAVTAECSAAEAKEMLKITVENSSAEAINGKIKINILAPGDSVVATGEAEAALQTGEKTIIGQQIVIKDPLLWSTESPILYKAEITLEKEGKTIDQVYQPFGIRTVEISAEKGFLLNGKPVELKGGCMHHDNGLLGSAAFDRAEERRVQLMKSNGFNAIRTSHNPPSEAFLDACDRIGMLVIDETFDMWQKPKNAMDYSRFFNDWWKKDVEAMILRDRNHPSVILWSIGNEIPERADTSGVQTAKELVSYIKTLDDTRGFTNAICEFWDHPGMKWEATAPAFEVLTVGGYNYQFQRYESDHEKYPERIMMGTESVPKDAYGNWTMVEKHPYVIGDFVWTGMDYLGETGIGHTQYMTKDQKDQFAMTWPWFNAWCGDIDVLGDKKPQMLYKDVLWGNSKLEMNVHAPVPEGKTEVVSYWGWPDEYPHWNWNGNEDKPLQVSVYTTGDEVKLMLNGREMGTQKVSPETKLTATFTVPYEPGELKAIAFSKGSEIAQKIFKTTGTPEAIKLTADRTDIKADRNDLAYVKIEIIDEFGQVVTDATKQVKITVSGDGEMAGSGNACPWDMKSVGKTTISTFHGKALLIVRPFAKEGNISIKATSEGLQDTELQIQVK
ncbi:MAG TPA: glycoside hydrolase family 2 TIM barrel-domain containing protein [Bacteroidales bacterium]|nr:glycoside hydrolase family 2 TIM barrel-domain containing protein [Bacteroidales bacterium]